MRKLSAIAILISIFAVGVCGFLAMHPGEMERMAGCIAAVVAGASCPAGTPLEQSMFHVDAFKSLSLATFAQEVQFLALIALAFFFAAFYFSSTSSGNKVQGYIVSRRQFREMTRAVPLVFRDFSRYIAFFTHSPCVA